MQQLGNDDSDSEFEQYRKEQLPELHQSVQNARNDPIEECVRHRSQEPGNTQKPGNDDLQQFLGERSSPLPGIKGKFYTNFLKDKKGRRDKVEDPIEQVLSIRKKMGSQTDKVSVEEAKRKKYPVYKNEQRKIGGKKFVNFVDPPESRNSSKSPNRGKSATTQATPVIKNFATIQKVKI